MCLLFLILSQFSQGPHGTLFPWCAAWRHVRGLDLAGMMARAYGSYAILHHSCNMQHTTCKRTTGILAQDNMAASNGSRQWQQAMATNNGSKQ